MSGTSDDGVTVVTVVTVVGPTVVTVGGPGVVAGGEEGGGWGGGVGVVWANPPATTIPPSNRPISRMVNRLLRVVISTSPDGATVGRRWHVYRVISRIMASRVYSIRRHPHGSIATHILGGRLQIL